VHRPAAGTRLDDGSFDVRPAHVPAEHAARAAHRASLAPKWDVLGLV
jgi:hypothetical protein